MLPSYTQVRTLQGRSLRRADSVSRNSGVGKVRELLAEDSKRPILESIKSALADLLSHTLQILHSGTRSNKIRTPMCLNYGHVIRRGGWGRGLPHCEECGITIKDPSELRKANLA